MILTQALTSIAVKWDLLKNPFYQAWSKGTLSTAALQRYASEYGKFIALVPMGWQTLGDAETASEEREHVELWQKFTHSIAATENSVDAGQPAALVDTARSLFAQPATALGALYAFEVHQPTTASSKLIGLRTHYQQLAANEEYFEAHLHNEHEAEKLLDRMSALSPEDQQIALAACETLSQSVWNTLAAMGSC